MIRFQVPYQTHTFPKAPNLEPTEFLQEKKPE